MNFPLFLVPRKFGEFGKFTSPARPVRPELGLLPPLGNHRPPRTGPGTGCRVPSGPGLVAVGDEGGCRQPPTRPLPSPRAEDGSLAGLDAGYPVRSAGRGKNVRITGLRLRQLTGILEHDGPYWEERLQRPIDVYPEYKARARPTGTGCRAH